eukprot:350847-Chlamydomonas_euryale.AAC.5
MTAAHRRLLRACALAQNSLPKTGSTRWCAFAAASCWRQRAGCAASRSKAPGQRLRSAPTTSHASSTPPAPAASQR